MNKIIVSETEILSYVSEAINLTDPKSTDSENGFGSKKHEEVAMLEARTFTPPRLLPAVERGIKEELCKAWECLRMAD